MANAYAAPVDPHSRNPAPLRPFQRVHIDHYICDVKVVVYQHQDDVYTLCPWMTVARDEASGCVIAFSIGFDAPSRRACCSVLRDCVVRNRRLPECIAVDNGKEFESTYFEAFLARYQVTKMSRPPGAPRFGGHIETAFKGITSFLNGLPGYKDGIVKCRAISRSHISEYQASLSLVDLYDNLERFLFDFHNASPSNDRSLSRSVFVEQGLQRFPTSGRPVELGSELLALSSIANRQLSPVDKQRGIRHKGRWYFAKELIPLKIGTKVQIFEDPWNSLCIFVLIGGTMIPCHHGRPKDISIWIQRADIARSVVELECEGLRRQLKLKKDRAIGRLLLDASCSKSSHPSTAKRTASAGKRSGQARRTSAPRPKPKPYEVI